MRRTRNRTATESEERINYSGKVPNGDGRYYSFCPDCGWRGDSNELVFDFSGLIREKVKSAIRKYKSEKLKKQNEQGGDAADISDNKSDGNDENTENTNTGENTENQEDAWYENAPIETFLSVGKIIENENKEFKVSDEEVKKLKAGLEPYIRKKGIHVDLKDEDTENVVACIEEELKQSFGEIELMRSQENDGVVNRVSIGNEPLARRYCPTCKKQVSEYSGMYPEITLSLFGGPRVSKTTAVCAAIYAFKNWRTQNSRRNNINVIFDTDKKLLDQWKLIKENAPNGTDAKTLQELQREYPLVAYGRNLRIHTTDVVETKVECTFCINFNGKKVLISVMDIPGELVQSMATADAERMRRVLEDYRGRYKNLDYLWICVDGEVLRDAGNQEQNQEQKQNDAYGYNGNRSALGITQLTNAFNNTYGLMSESLRGIAVIWGKIDAVVKDNNGQPTVEQDVEPYLLRTWTLYKNYERRYKSGYGVIDDSYSLEPEMIERQAAFVRDVMGKDELFSAVENTKKRVCVFATSNYGHVPRGGDNTEGDSSIRPFNTMLPLVWMLAMEGIIKVKVRERNWLGRKTDRYRTLENEEEIKTLLCLRRMIR